MRRTLLILLGASVSLLAIQAASPAATPVGGASYASKTSQGEPIQLTVARNRLSAPGLYLVVVAACSDGSTQSHPIRITSGAGIRISRTGAFSATIRLHNSATSTDALIISGQFRNSKTASGTFRESYSYPDGATSAASNVTFTAVRGARPPAERSVSTAPTRLSAPAMGCTALNNLLIRAEQILKDDQIAAQLAYQTLDPNIPPGVACELANDRVVKMQHLINILQIYYHAGCA